MDEARLPRPGSAGKGGRTGGGGRVLFAQHLRAVAVASVAAGHYLGTFWTEPGLVAAAIMGPPHGGQAPAVTAWLGHPFLQLAPFGVALFFLISGFVIPFSLQRHRPGAFLGARLWRIYPTYMAGLSIGLAAVAAMALWSGQPFTLGWGRIAANLLLVQGLFGLPSIDMVNWTLVVELKFYLLMALLRSWLRRPGVLAAAGLACAAGYLALYAASLPVPSGLLRAEVRAQFDLGFLPYMLIGTLFWLHGQGARPAPLLAGGAVLAASAWAALRGGPLPYLGWALPVPYAQALLVFWAAYALRRLVRRNGLLEALAAVSYPLYAVHTLVGYAAMTWLLAAGAGPWAALAGAAAAALAIAAALHVTVERASIAAGQRLRTPAAPPLVRPVR